VKEIKIKEELNMKKWLVTALFALVTGGATVGIYTSAVSASTVEGVAAVGNVSTIIGHMLGSSENPGNDQEVADDTDGVESDNESDSITDQEMDDDSSN
jgi:hypothetical protein